MNKHVLARAVAGGLGGLLGGLAMKVVVHYVAPDAFGLSTRTDAKTAHDIYRRMDWPSLEEWKAEQIGAALHYTFAIAAGIGYGVAAQKFPKIRAGRGSLFGATLWLVGDELAIWASRLEDPRQASVRAHASALGAHVLYGCLIDTALVVAAS